MTNSIYLINPAGEYPTYFGGEVFASKGFQSATLFADLAIPTVAAMVPRGWDITLCDENIAPVEFDVPAKFIGITGKITQWKNMRAIAAEFRRRGKIVIFGGPYASLSPDVVRPHCDILIRGEMEDIAEEVFTDLASGKWKREYVGDKPDLRNSPIPRWDLYPNDRALVATLQTSRGCPFECEFCDVIQYLGRKQRHKSPDQVIAELDVLYALGYREILLADDNLTVYRKHAKELLTAIRDWNLKQTNGKVCFCTQLSIDAAKDSDLLQLCAEAGLTTVFIGIETPNVDSLRETKKRQNVNVDLALQIQKFLEKGIAVVAGMIAGFDSDNLDIFRKQYEFAMSLPVPVFTLGPLVAPDATPLNDRMKKEGRLIEDGSEVAGTPWATSNIVPKNMSREQLADGVKWLCEEIYHPTAFRDRVLLFLEAIGEGRDPRCLDKTIISSNLRAVDSDKNKLLLEVANLGVLERKMIQSLYEKCNGSLRLKAFVNSWLLRYIQIRHMHDCNSNFEQMQLDRQMPAENNNIQVLTL